MANYAQKNLIDLRITEPNYDETNPTDHGLRNHCYAYRWLCLRRL